MQAWLVSFFPSFRSIDVHVYFCISWCISARQKNSLDPTEKPCFLLAFGREGTEGSKYLLTPLYLLVLYEEGWGCWGLQPALDAAGTAGLSSSEGGALALLQHPAHTGGSASTPVPSFSSCQNKTLRTATNSLVFTERGRIDANRHGHFANLHCAYRYF